MLTLQKVYIEGYTAFEITTAKAVHDQGINSPQFKLRAIDQPHINGFNHLEQNLK